MGKFLNRKKRKKLLEELKSGKMRRYADRLRVILLLDENETDKNYVLGFSFKKPRTVLGKAVMGKQKDFIKKYKREKSQRGLIYSGNATSPIFNTALDYGWIKKGEGVKANPERPRLNISGAIEINSLNVIARPYSIINQYSICCFLRAIRNKNPDEKRITLIIDNANYYTANTVKALARKPRIKLLYLPSYSPSLNPIERLWEFIKRRTFPNKYHKNFLNWKYQMMIFFTGIQKYRPGLKALITDNFQVMGT